MGLTKDQVRAWLTNVPHPAGGDIVSKGTVVNIAACDGNASVRLTLVQGPKDPDPSEETMKTLGSRVVQTIASGAMASGLGEVALSVEFVDHNGNVMMRLGAKNGTSGEASAAEPGTNAPPPPQESASGIEGVKHIIAVGAGKGGVGKSTISVNLAVGLARNGHDVGLLDGDIYGPSLPTMLGLDAMEQTALEGSLQPFYVHGIKAVTMGKL
ncbi:MAG: P-loop NTPase, partial [Planctomycetota bacterium]